MSSTRKINSRNSLRLRLVAADISDLPSRDENVVLNLRRQHRKEIHHENIR